MYSSIIINLSYEAGTRFCSASLVIMTIAGDFCCQTIAQKSLTVFVVRPEVTDGVRHRPLSRNVRTGDTAVTLYTESHRI